MLAPFTKFQIQLALHGIRQFLQSLKASVEVIVLAGGQCALMVLALLSWPLWMNTLGFSQGWPLPKVLALLFSYSALLSLPVFLLRKRLIPEEISIWQRSLPLKPSDLLRADIALASWFVLPLMLIYGISSIACLIEMRELHSHLFSGSLMLASSLCLFLVFCLLIFQSRRYILERRFSTKKIPASTASEALNTPVRAIQMRHLNHLQQSYRLFFLYFWRNERGVLISQTLLFIAGAAMLVLWQMPAQPFLRFVFCIASTSLILLQSEQAIKQVQDHAVTLHSYLRTLPVAGAKLERIAKLICIVPALILLSGFAILLKPQAEMFYMSVAQWYFALQLSGLLSLVLLGHFPRAVRVRILMLCMVLLSAIGSELWK